MPHASFFRHTLPLTLWRLLPFAGMLLLVTPQALPTYGSRALEIVPPLALMAGYYWGLQDMRRFPFAAALFFGFVFDALMLTPFGLNALLWLGFRAVLERSRAAVEEEGFVVGWALLTLLVGLYLSLQWAAMGLLTDRIYPLSGVFMQWLLAVLLYPALHQLLWWVERGFRRRWWFLLKA